jgi:High potential iron-sulfur protein
MKRKENDGTDAGRELSRRRILKASLLGAALPAIPFLSAAQAATPLVPLDPNDAQAKALGYVTDTAKVDAKANPAHKPDQTCSRCLQFVGTPADKTGGCKIFPGKSVAGPGWCKVYVLKPGA